jgi:hypothetical protein
MTKCEWIYCHAELLSAIAVKCILQKGSHLVDVADVPGVGEDQMEVAATAMDHADSSVGSD